MKKVLEAVSAAPVFIVGFPRSGTTLLRTALAQHPALNVHEVEPHYVLDLYDRFGVEVKDISAAAQLLVGHRNFPSRKVQPYVVKRLFEGTKRLPLAVFLEKYFSLLFDDAEAKPLVLKLPRAVFKLDVVQKLWPNARVIHVVRDPRGALASHLARWPGEDLWSRVETWKRAVRAGHEWVVQHPNAGIIVHFEKLVTDPAARLGHVCRLIGAEFHKAMLDLDYRTYEFSLNDPGSASTRRFRHFDASKIDQWKENLSPSQVQFIERRCQHQMARLGYEATRPAANKLAYWAYWLKGRFSSIARGGPF